MSVSPRLQQAAQRAVDACVADVKGVRGAVVSTEDGFEVAARVDNSAQVSRLAAMAGSLAALGQVAGEETELGACQGVMIEAAGGHLVMAQARCADITLIVSLVASRDAVLGQLLFQAREAARKLELA